MMIPYFRPKKKTGACISGNRGRDIRKPHSLNSRSKGRKPTCSGAFQGHLSLSLSLARISLWCSFYQWIRDSHLCFFLSSEGRWMFCRKGFHTCCILLVLGSRLMSHRALISLAEISRTRPFVHLLWGELISLIMGKKIIKHYLFINPWPKGFKLCIHVVPSRTLISF